ncbi:MAG: hypothetical protein MUO40_07615 [Anaerolineaceae bacterium]|nr:hypothetical protein [Anaerolineaceae bacterium]
MDSGMIGKIDKAKRYAEERERISFKNFEVTFRGDNNLHTTKFVEGQWQCTCHYFQTRGLCGHTMAMEIVLEGMLPESGK